MRDPCQLGRATSTSLANAIVRARRRSRERRSRVCFVRVLFLSPRRGYTYSPRYRRPLFSRVAPSTSRVGDTTRRERGVSRLAVVRRDPLPGERSTFGRDKGGGARRIKAGRLDSRIRKKGPQTREREREAKGEVYRLCRERRKKKGRNEEINHCSSVDQRLRLRECSAISVSDRHRRVL